MIKNVFKMGILSMVIFNPLMVSAKEIQKIVVNEENAKENGIAIRDNFYTYDEYIKMKTGCVEYDLINISSSRKYKNTPNTFHYMWVECKSKRQYQK